MFIDTHCHIHETQAATAGTGETSGLWARFGDPDPNQLVAQAEQAGVGLMICVGTTVADSQLAVDFVHDRPQCWASIGVHPHEAKAGDWQQLRALLSADSATPYPSGLARAQKRVRNTGNVSLPDTAPPSLPLPGSALPRSTKALLSRRVQRARSILPLELARPETSGGAPNKIVAIGECGLDYFYTHSPRVDQIKALRFQIELALQHDLPLIFHVREAFDDFWPIFDDYHGIRGVLHSFTDTQANLDKALARGLFIGVNGIATFTKNEAQIAMYRAIPLQNLLLETDAPFLTPVPLRGKMNTPANVRLVAEFLSELRGESLAGLAHATTHNAQTLFMP